MRLDSSVNLFIQNPAKYYLQMGPEDTLKAVPRPEGVVRYAGGYSGYFYYSQDIKAQNLQDLKNLAQADQVAQKVFITFRELQKYRANFMPKRQLSVDMEEELNVWCEQAVGTPEYSSRVVALQKIEEAYLSNSKELDLKNLRLTSLQNNIGSLDALEDLRINYNNLTVLPETIGNLVALEYLDLSNNTIEELPGTFTQLISLKRLFLSENALSVFPEAIRQFPHLKVLSLKRNQIRDIPLNIANCLSQLRIFMERNLLTDATLRNIHAAIAQAHTADPTRGPQLSPAAPPVMEVPLQAEEEDWFIAGQQQGNVQAINEARQQAEEGALFLKQIMDDMLSTMSHEAKNEFYEKVESSDPGLYIEMTQKATAKATQGENPPMFYTKTVNALAEEKRTFDDISTQLQRSVDFRAALERAYELIIQARPPAA